MNPTTPNRSGCMSTMSNSIYPTQTDSLVFPQITLVNQSFSHEGLLPPNCPGLASLPVHGKVPRLQNTCAGCNTSFSTNSDLEQHASSSGHTAFSCTCGKQFSRAYTLTRHINSTIGLSFTCELCDDKAFTRLDKLSDHLRRWHRLGTKALDQYKGGNSPPSLASRPPGGIPPLTSEAPGRAYPVGPEVDPMSMLNGFNSATNTALGALSIHTSAGPEGSAGAENWWNPQQSQDTAYSS